MDASGSSLPAAAPDVHSAVDSLPALAAPQLSPRLHQLFLDRANPSHSQPGTPPINAPSRVTDLPANFVAVSKAGDFEQWQKCPHCTVYRCLCDWGINQWEYLPTYLYVFSYTLHCMCEMHICFQVCVWNTHRYEYVDLHIYLYTYMHSCTSYIYICTYLLTHHVTCSYGMHVYMYVCTCGGTCAYTA